VTGQHWGYCDPALHNGESVPATWWVKGLSLVPLKDTPGTRECWTFSVESGSTWAACHDHLQHACQNLLERYSRVSVMECP
jgi:hypothetical protein